MSAARRQRSESIVAKTMVIPVGIALAAHGMTGNAGTIPTVDGQRSEQSDIALVYTGNGTAATSHVEDVAIDGPRSRMPTPVLLPRGSSLFDIIDPSVVLETKTFLLEHGHLWPVIREAREKLREYFGPGPQRLELCADEEDDYGFLSLVVEVEMDPKDVFERQGRFNQDWWDERWAAANGLVSIDVVYL